MHTQEIMKMINLQKNLTLAETKKEAKQLLANLGISIPIKDKTLYFFTTVDEKDFYLTYHANEGFKAFDRFNMPQPLSRFDVESIDTFINHTYKMEISEILAGEKLTESIEYPDIRQMAKKNFL